MARIQDIPGFSYEELERRLRAAADEHGLRPIRRSDGSILLVDPKEALNAREIIGAVAIVVGCFSLLVFHESQESGCLVAGALILLAGFAVGVSGVWIRFFRWQRQVLEEYLIDLLEGRRSEKHIEGWRAATTTCPVCTEANPIAAEFCKNCSSVLS